jgi:hypothetical protein
MRGISPVRFSNCALRLRPANMPLAVCVHAKLGTPRGAGDRQPPLYRRISRRLG